MNEVFVIYIFINYTLYSFLLIKNLRFLKRISWLFFAHYTIPLLKEINKHLTIFRNDLFRKHSFNCKINLPFETNFMIQCYFWVEFPFYFELFVIFLTKILKNLYKFHIIESCRKIIIPLLFN